MPPGHPLLELIKVAPEEGKAWVLFVVRQEHGDYTRASARLGCKYRTLTRLIKSWGLIEHFAKVREEVKASVRFPLPRHNEKQDV